MSSNKLEGIQILRGYAAMLVVVTHLWSVGVISSTLRFSRIGGLGVDIFFVISGFIMCYSLKDRVLASDSFQFLKKRAYRVYPIYLLVLIPFLIQYLSQAKVPVDPLLIIGNIIYRHRFLARRNIECWWVRPGRSRMNFSFTCCLLERCSRRDLKTERFTPLS